MKHRWIAITAGAIAAIAFLAGCAPAGGPAGQGAGESVQATGDTYHKINAEEAKEMMDVESGVVVVDVRTPEEYAEKHIEGAVNIPNEAISDTPPEALADKDAKLIVYCRTGVRSKQASDKLVNLGYTNVYDMGGINDWPYETVSGKQAEGGNE
ncbi:rhodanese-like domain-containing protein [Christensenella intestinihominis]|uniref:rhodanese-like domain-containing protein n=1 Tax=Christensenella intestinihominis TaxID=1851429 RepID=UPI0008360D2D|nr:rhodanese-like domain-containing protein [Christensenella intestinihominis]